MRKLPFSSRLAFILLGGTICASQAVAGPDDAKPASPATIAAQGAAISALPIEDGRDERFATQGFVATRSDPLIRAADGHVVWNLDEFAFITGKAPPTVNPGLWRENKLLRFNGLFRVADGVWQVRGFDNSNMTIIAGAKGWIVIDPLMTRETAAAAMALVNAQLGARPVSSVIYSHSHPDHFGGVRGIVDEKDVRSGKIAIIAPEHFMDEVSAESIIAGPVIGRRASYSIGAALGVGDRERVGDGVGMDVPHGEVTLIAPTDSITHTGETRMVDGVQLEFQMAMGSEAPSEMNVYIAPARTFLAAETATCSLHNLLPPRGSKVRDALLWAGYLDEAARLYAPKSDTLIMSHCWPRFGHAEVAGYLVSQRDNYRYLHDQTVRLMNQGQTAGEIADSLKPVPSLAAQWYNHGFYGTYRHDSRAVYQLYLGWFDGVPSHLDPLPQVERATHYVAAMGGAEKVLAEAHKAMAAGDYRWSSEILQNLVFADASNAKARTALADSYEQQGYQAESAIWRNTFLSAAHELRSGIGRVPQMQASGLLDAVPTIELLDAAATRFAPGKFTAGNVVVNLVFPERHEIASIEADGVTVIGRSVSAQAADVTITAPRLLLLGLLSQRLSIAQLEAAGGKVEGNRDKLQALLAAIDPMPGPFNIVTP